jgi:hypothetical protein
MRLLSEAESCNLFSDCKMGADMDGMDAMDGMD